MNTASSSVRPDQTLFTRSLLRVAAMTLPLLLAGCGAETKTGSNGTGRTPDAPDPTVASGPLNGLGPLEVAGVSLDESGTAVAVNNNFAANTQALRIGMTANASGSATVTTGTGRASGAVAQSWAVGPAREIDAANGRLAVLSHRFMVNQNTLFEGVGSLAALVPGDPVEVFGLPMESGATILATRVTVRRGADPTQVELLGRIDQVGTATASFSGLNINLAGARILSPGVNGVTTAAAGPAALASGTLARISGTLDAQTGSVNAATVLSGLAPARAEGDVVYLEGFVQSRQGATRLTLADQAVDITGIPLFPTSADVGARLRIRGVMRTGVLRAETVEVIPAGAVIEYSLVGQVSDYLTLSSFKVRGETIDASQARFINGQASNLAAGRTIGVKGRAENGKLLAREIIF